MRRNRLLQLLADNRQVPQRAFTVRAAAAADEAEILLYDTIVDSALEAEWWGGVAPEPFVKALREIDASTIHLRINSPGGSVFAARAMETALREHKARIVVHIDALAASAASVLAMAGDEIIMSKGAMMMIHNAWTITWGNAAELKATAALLDKIDGTLVETYADRSGTSAADIRAWMAAETWFTAQEAIDAGLADKVAEAGSAAAQARWNLEAFRNTPTGCTTREAAAPDDRPQGEGAGAPSVAPPVQTPAQYASADHRERINQRAHRMRVAAPIE